MADPALARAATGSLVVRPIADTDAAAFGALHGRADAAAVRALIAESQQALAAEGPGPLRQVFVLVDRAHAAGGLDPSPADRLLGAVALVTSVGLDLPRYSFRRGTVVHASAELKLFHRAGTLLLGNDLTGGAELGLPLMVSADSAAAPQRVLIDAVLLLLADRADRCAATLVAALPGIGYDHGGAPFWSGLGRHFHHQPVPPNDPFFSQPARSHIGRLLPKHPLYTSFLSADAQACIGQRAIHAREADDALRAQGLRPQGHVDIFDGGPMLMADVADLRAVRESRRLPLIAPSAALPAGSVPALVHGVCLVSVPGRDTVVQVSAAVGPQGIALDGCGALSLDAALDAGPLAPGRIVRVLRQGR